MTVSFTQFDDKIELKNKATSNVKMQEMQINLGIHPKKL